MLKLGLVDRAAEGSGEETAEDIAEETAEDMAEEAAEETAEVPEDGIPELGDRNRPLFFFSGQLRASWPARFLQ